MTPQIGSCVLVAFVGNDLAEELEAVSDEAAVERALAALELRFPAAREAFLSGFMTRWCQDPFARGSYTSLVQGSRESDYDAIAEVCSLLCIQSKADGAVCVTQPLHEGRVRFAGEGTMRYDHSTVHGALMSGYREADAIWKAIV